MNFLTIVLCLSMNRQYQEYYFVPLISFWFSVQYLLITIPPVVSRKTTEWSTESKQCLVLHSVGTVSQLIVSKIGQMMESHWKKPILRLFGTLPSTEESSCCFTGYYFNPHISSVFLPIPL